MQPEFLLVSDMLAIHVDQVERYGGSPDLRDAGLPESAVETPRATFNHELLHADLFEMAAAYLYHIVSNHPFVDGNKRTGTAAAIVFLNINGVEVDADQDDLADLVLAVAQSKVVKADVVRFLRSHSR